MPISQNGYPANDVSLTRVYTIGNGRQVRLADGPAGELLVAWADWFDEHIEDVDQGADDWGYAERTIRGDAVTLSNHASGTALDLNATRHPLGQRGTFTKAQTSAIRAELARYDGAIRWGGDYQNRPDEMHFEINAPLATVRRVLAEVEDDMALTDQDVEKVADAVWRRVLKSADGNGAGRVLGFLYARQLGLAAAIDELAKGLDPAVQAAVKEAIAEGVVDVDVTVHDQTGD